MRNKIIESYMGATYLRRRVSELAVRSVASLIFGLFGEGSPGLDEMRR